MNKNLWKGKEIYKVIYNVKSFLSRNEKFGQLKATKP